MCQQLLGIAVVTWMIRWSPGRRRLTSVLLMAPIPLEVSTAASAPSRAAILAASA